MSPARILFSVEAVTLAHVARTTVLADGLRRAGYQVFLASSRAYSHLTSQVRVPQLPLDSISSERFVRALRDGKRIYDLPTLRRYVEEDLELLERVRPDLVVGDFRLSLSVSARMAKIPYWTITNAHWSPGAARLDIMPEHPLTRALGVRMGSLVGSFGKPVVVRHFLEPMNRLRGEHGLAPYGSLPEMYTEADRTLYLDDPAVVSVDPMPSGHSYLGPVQWSPKVALPAWWDRVPEDEPMVYVNLGSSGSMRGMRDWLGEFGRAPYTFLVASVGQPIPARLPNNVFMAPYLPGEVACNRASVMVCNGGSGAIYQALAAGKPVVGICSNMDQHLVMTHVERVGFGIGLRSELASGKAAVGAIGRVLSDPSLAHRARGLAELVRCADPVGGLLRALNPWLGPTTDEKRTHLPSNLGSRSHSMVG
jgi:UDP:flavonoid glycosyltransferase YjiC (YdhE family)